MKEALKLALEAADGLKDVTRRVNELIAENKALKAALAQPIIQNYLEKDNLQQEPVAYLCENAVGHKYFRWKKPSNTYKPIPLYTTPPQRTEERNFCSRCGKRTADLTVIHTCTPPQENT